jgi:glycosyltransferase involved in cell wall biosynthesis
MASNEMGEGKRKDNLLFIDSGFGYGGSAIFLYNFLRRLNKEAFNPTVMFYFPPQGGEVENIRNLGIKVVNLGMNPEKKQDYSFAVAISQGQAHVSRLRVFTNYLKAVQELIQLDLPAVINLVKLIKKKGIELVILNNDLHYHVPGVLAARLAGAGCLCRKAGIGGGRKIKKIIGRLVDAFWAISQAAALDQILMKVPTKRLVTFYGGVDMERYDPTKNGREVRREFNIPEDKPIVGSIARIGMGKGHNELVQAAVLVTKEFPQAVFLIVGDDLEFGGVFREKLKKQATQLGVRENLIFAGWRTDIPNILAGLDVFVHCPTSLAEGLGIGTLEAMAMGKPTIVSDNFGLKETTLDKVTGFVVPKGDVLALSQAILTLLKDRKLASDMGKRARLQAERLFDIRKNVRQVEELFLELLT